MFIGCLLEDQYGNKQEIKIHDFLRFLVHPNENLVFVVCITRKKTKALFSTKIKNIYLFIYRD